jgi:hypothetical protein
MGGDSTPRWDFFVSYTQQDRRWAEWIAWQLEDAGYRVLLQAWDMIPGTHWQLKMQEGINYSERTVAVVSSAYLDSVYGRQEWQGAVAADPRGFERKLIPVRVEDCDLPGLLGKIVSFDVFGMDASQAQSHFREQISIILSGRAKPSAPPAYPGRTAQPGRQPARAPGAAYVVRRLGAIPDHTGRVSAAAFDGQGSVLATGGTDRIVIIWDVLAGAWPRRTATLTGYNGHVTALAFGGPAGTLLAAGAADWTLSFWDVADPARPRRVRSVQAHRGRVKAVAFAPGGRCLATGGADGVVRLWDASDPGQPAAVAELPTHGPDVTSVTLTADGARLAACAADGVVGLWDVTDPARPSQTATAAGECARAVAAVAPDGSLLAVGGRGGALAVWDAADPARPARLAAHPAHPDADVTALAFSPADRTVLVSGGSDGLVVVWDLDSPASPERAAALNDHRGRIEALAFDPDGRVLATGSADTAVGLWSVG